MSPLLRRAADAAVTLALLAAVFGAPWPYAATAGGLLMLRLTASYRDVTPGADLAVSLATAVTLPLCLEAAGAGAAAVLAAALALPRIEAALRRLAASPDPALVSHEGGGVRIVPERLRPLPGFPNRGTTPLFRTLLLIGVITAGVGLVAGNAVAVGTGIAVIVWLLAVLASILRRLPPSFVTAVQPHVRVLAGARVQAVATLVPVTTLEPLLVVSSPVAWADVRPGLGRLGPAGARLELTVTPPLAGPSTLEADAAAVDPWGLTVTRRRIAVASLRIIPRARYATWLARRFLDQTRPDAAGTSAGPAHGRREVRGGIEYRGARPYEAGDTLRTIDWKHTAKLRSLVVKDFHASGAQTAVLAVGLEAPDADAADRLAYQVVMTTLTLAQEDVPVALAAYTDADVVRVTAPLPPRDAVRNALALIDAVAIAAPPRRLFEPPALGRIRRIQAALAAAGSANGLAQVLRLEIQALLDSARIHPSARALKKALGRCRPPAGIMSLSVTGEPVVPLDVALTQLQQRGYDAVLLNGASAHPRVRAGGARA